jgi:hypothetical protein
MSYIKSTAYRDAIDSIFSEVDDQANTRERIDEINSLVETLNRRLTLTYAKAAYEHRKSGIPADVTAVELGISVRAVLRLSTWYRRINNLAKLNAPKFVPADVVDLRRSVAMDTPHRTVKRKRDPADPQADRRYSGVDSLTNQPTVL